MTKETHIKLIWDFRGPDGKGTADHHCIHLKEFAATERLYYKEIGTEEISDFHCTAFIIVKSTEMKIYRDALKPHRGVHA